MAVEGTRVWLPDPNESFVEAEVIRQMPDGSLIVRDLLTRKEKTLKTMNELLFCNADVPGGYEDMTNLNHLNEAAILHNLRFRFNLDSVYTYCGKTCIAVNPFKWLDLYGEHRMKQYHEGTPESEPPHIFSVAETAYRNLCKMQKNQSILVSGESGAGKTETTKLLLRYLARVASSGREEITEQVLQSNPLLEAFGNAKTVRNDNSSRFGKFIELQFDKANYILGASIQTYLLEKSRVVYLSKNERNYHIFYQLIAGADATLRAQLCLADDPKAYFYLNQSNCMVLDSTSDADDFKATCRAMEVIGLTKEQQNSVLRIIAGILHLGQLRFVTRRRQEEAAHVDNPDQLEIVSRVLGVPAEKLTEALCFRRIVAMNETYSSPNNVQLASSTRDALAKFLYGRLFDWLVDRINRTTRREENKTGFIGILDIFGFECFEKNSFEQLCINYANEKLQQQYTQDIFKTVQDEYAAEKIPWSFVDFVDNQECLNLLESKMGVFSLLNEECLVPKGSDASLLTKYQAILSANKYFQKEKVGNESFSVFHFAGKVIYSVANFLEKNKDTLVPDLVTAMSSSNDVFIRDLATSGKKVESGSKAARDNFLASQFKIQLTSLMATIQSTNVHYIRCIKPNMLNKPATFQNLHVSNQLKYAGVLEAIRISRAAYPNRLHHDEFYERFKLLAPNTPLRPSNAEKSRIIRRVLETYFEDEASYQIGVTRVYFRHGIQEELEKIRTEKLSVVILRIQKSIRMWLVARRYRMTKKNTVKIQAITRMFLKRKRYNRVRKAVILCQAIVRMWFAKKRVHSLRRKKSALIIQKTWRMFLCRKKFVLYRASIVRIQSLVRMKQSRKKYLIQLHEVREAAKLENQLLLLQKKLQDEINSRSALELEKQALQAELERDAPAEEYEEEEEGEEDIEVGQDENQASVPDKPPRALQQPSTAPAPKIVKKKSIVYVPKQSSRASSRSTSTLSPNTGVVKSTSSVSMGMDIVQDTKEMLELLQSEIERTNKKLQSESARVQTLQENKKKLEERASAIETKVHIDSTQRRPIEDQYKTVAKKRGEKDSRLREVILELTQLKNKYRNEMIDYDRAKKGADETKKELESIRHELDRATSSKRRIEEEKEEMKNMMKFEAHKTAILRERLNRVLQENQEYMLLSQQSVDDTDDSKDIPGMRSSPDRNKRWTSMFRFLQNTAK
eukprot:TRINITY_DN3556_c0_g6_i1.p1 TRINITY_DN3556_c0_g6~~TRINITY_DN3556_c0_g6_i1.p1  ORF type:complete len:1192 (-),score=267.72 TRINITY_DN3556_c0_g6_i1:190-3765(-)